MTMELSWSDLPDDLLHLVYAKVVGLLQRVRFAAVCTSWRDAAIVSRHAAPPALPCHISSFGGSRDRTKRMYCPEDGEVLGIRVPNIAVVRRFVGAHDGGWIAALTRKRVKLVVVNLFSGVEVPLSVKQRKFVHTSEHDGACTIRKVVFSDAPTSSGCILAALTCSGGVALCRVGCSGDDGWMMMTRARSSRFVDIAFCNGRLYGLTTSKDLGRFIITNRDGATSLVVTRLLPVHRAPSAHPFDLDNSTYKSHLFDLGGNLAMARSRWSCWDNTMPLFNLFELRQGNMLKWEETTSVAEHALFLGETCSKAVRVPAGGRGQVKGNCIYSANALYFANGARLYHGQQNGESVRMIRVEHVSQHGMWLIPPSV